MCILLTEGDENAVGNVLSKNVICWYLLICVHTFKQEDRPLHPCITIKLGRCFIIMAHCLTTHAALAAEFLACRFFCLCYVA